MKKILVLGGGFAGLWSAVGAARELDELGIGSDQVEITLVNRDAYHNIRVRDYEADLSQVRIPLDDVLQPIGVKRIEGQVVDIDHQQQSVTIDTCDGHLSVEYDRLIFALGSRLYRPNIPGLEKYTFAVDTYNEATQLNAHLNSLPTQPESPVNTRCWWWVLV